MITSYASPQVVTVFGVFGACRTDELVNVVKSHISTPGDIILVKIPDTKTKVERSFTISDEYAEIVKRYMALRPKKELSTRFFLNYQKGRCTSQVIGKHKFSGMPSVIAQWLELPNPKRYTGTYSNAQRTRVSQLLC